MIRVITITEIRASILTKFIPQIKHLNKLVKIIKKPVVEIEKKVINIKNRTIFIRTLLVAILQ
jgi:hypothetical protein